MSVRLPVLDVTFINNGYVNATTGGDLDSTAYSGWIGDATNGPAIFYNQTSGSMSGSFYSGRNVNVYNAGTIHLPADQSGRIRHNYEQIDYGTLSIEIDGDGYSTNEYSAWRVDGIMDGDRIEVRVADGARLEEGTLTQVIRAGTLETQDRDDWTVLNSHYLYTFTPDVSIGSKFENVNLWVTSRTFEEALEEDNPRFAKYAKNGAKALDELFSQNTSAAMDSILNSLVNSSAEQVAKFEANMQPITNIAWYTTQLVTQVSDAIGDRQLRMRDRGIASGDTGTPGEGHVWVKVFGTDTEQDNKGANPGYDADSYGFAIGIDGQVSQEWLLGIAGSYTNADLDYDSPLNQKVEMKGGQLSLYGSFTPTMQDFVDLIVTAGGNDNDTRRILPATSSTSTLRANGSFDSWYIRGYAGYGHDFIMGQQQDVTLTPVVSLAYTYVDNDSYRESGAGAMNLSVPSEDADTLVLALDLLAAVNFGPRQSVQLSGRVGVGYDFLANNNSNNITATFISDSGTSILGTGIEPDEWVYRAGVGLEVAATERLDLSINYDVQGRKDFVDQFYAANARWAF